ncbi:hypothetical protein J7E79_29670 [Bacillus sp. ISL-40]|uniref:hypothetical protein n=1 Tax=unclassified Bacillus (in: firmicutes) TaxID=185979 RepID=UPI001BE59329|nr:MULTISPECIES: hypothetical protein [unclassified Bacillus (in: firmicutes)]MBT2701423.1 hypothetical protein [Bacillus sp. ISL-40]MBT2744288.1 hypothetical protein [Bacillus sp. ISL-77]
MRAEQRIKELSITLPEKSTPDAMYIPVKQLGNALFVSGQTMKKKSYSHITI